MDNQKKRQTAEQQKKVLPRHLTPLAALAFSIGTSVGWGSLVVTAGTYLKQAGPMGSVLGLVAGALVMLLISRSYTYLMYCFPDAGGAYAYAREVFGFDMAFLTAWFLAMTYFAILWANTISLPLFCRVFIGDFFCFGRLYTVLGVDIYIGEVLLCVFSLAAAGVLCSRMRKLTDILMIVLSAVFTLGIVVCMIGVLGSGGRPGAPAFVPDTSVLARTAKIAVISPWAFIGFEAISHGAEEFTFDREKSGFLLPVSIFFSLLLYVLVTLLSVTAYPPRFDSWLSYIRSLGSLDGLESLPAFYAANHYLGAAGVKILLLALFALVLTSLIGNTFVLSRLLFSLARDRILPSRLAELNDKGIPSSAIFAVAAVSSFVPLFGRTAIGWIVDVTTIGATLIYGIMCAAAAEMARKMKNRQLERIGWAGVFFMIAFGGFLLIPNLFMRGSFSKETYLLFILWSALGFLIFRNVLHRDSEKRLGSSIAVWAAQLSLVLFIALVWIRQSMFSSNDRIVEEFRSHYRTGKEEQTVSIDDDSFINDQIERTQQEDSRLILAVVALFAFAQFILLTNHRFMSRQSEESEKLANIDPLTGVKSKHAYLSSEKEYDSQIMEGIDKPFAVVVCDVNGLKKINDTLGHKAGDEYIRKSCKMVCDIFQHSPVYRIGGDEFVVIISGRDYSVRKELMLSLHDRSVEHIDAGGAVVSAGLSDFRPGEDMSFHDVFQRADGRMYEEKQLLKGLGSVTREQEEAETEEEQKQQQNRNDEESSILRIRRKILIVDDEQINQMMLGNVLSRDYDLLYAADGVEAIERIRAHMEELELVLLDLLMPRLSGKEVLKSMKGDPGMRRIPVIVVTSDQSAEAECLRLGAMDFIPKPYPLPEIILARVDKCIELNENRDIIQSTERDSLTTLFNIDYFHRYVKLYDQHYWEMEMDAIVIDVNHFHTINERYGRLYGDSVLRRIGERIRGISREIGGVACRSAADSFWIYCPHRMDHPQLLEKASEVFTKEETETNRVRLRLGIYMNVDKTLDIDRRFDYAKIAANTVRNSYVHSVGIYDSEMREAEIFQERLLEGFSLSIGQGRFLVYYQPKIDIREEKPVLAGAEALVRWNHPDFGLLRPASFIPLLEENGLILELDKYVWKKTAEQMRSWKERFGFIVPVSVNVSRIDLLSPEIEDILQETLRQNGLKEDEFILEITESAYTGDSDQVVSAARNLRNAGKGFRIEMDDFGTGYSSLAMLSHLPLDAIKLDMSFLRTAFGENKDMRMIELILDLARYLEVPVVAEGVETEEQYLALREKGCDYVQGYYFSKPVPAEAFEHFLSEAAKEERKGTSHGRGI